MCTVLLRFNPAGRWPLLLAAVRDEFAERPWDPPARHWDGPAAGLVGGRDRVAGGTWLAVAPDRPARAASDLPAAATPDLPTAAPAVAAVLNGVPLPAPPDGARPSRGNLPLTLLSSGRLPDLPDFDGFHLLSARPDRVDCWTWDGVAVQHQTLAPGDHIVVNAGVDPADHPLVAHFQPLLHRTADPDPRPGSPPEQAWGGWLRLLAGDGLDPTDPRALLVRRPVAGRTYASTSASLLALRPGGVRYDFTGSPGPAAGWQEVAVAGHDRAGPVGD